MSASAAIIENVRGTCDVLATPFESYAMPHNTDPSRELADLIKWLKDRPDSGDPVCAVVANSLGLPESSSTFLELVTAIRRRLDSFQTMVGEIDPSEPRPGEAEAVLAAASNLMDLFAPRVLAMQWTSARKKFVLYDDAIALISFSQIAVRYKPLRLIGPDERGEIKRELEASLAGIEKADMPAWAQVPLRESLMRLLAIIEHVAFFGHEFAQDELLLLHQKASRIAEKVGDTPAKTWGVMKVLNAAMFAANLIATPANTVIAIQQYETWLQPKTLPSLLPGGAPMMLGPSVPGNGEAIAQGDSDPSHA